MSCVKFSYHSAERLQKRLRVNIDFDNYVNISKQFILADSYIHNEKRIWCDAYVYKNANDPIVLIVARNVKTVMTVYIGTELSGRDAPFVDNLYKKVKHKLSA